MVVRTTRNVRTADARGSWAIGNGGCASPSLDRPGALMARQVPQLSGAPVSRHSYHCPVRWSDLDANGHLNSSRYGVLLEEARMRMFSMLVPKDPAERLARNFLLREPTIRYKHPLETWETPVRIEAWVTDVKRVSTFHFEVKDDERVYATATSVVAGYDSIRSGIRRFEQDELDVFNSYADSTQDAGN